jgi:hypothetical protein
VCTAGVCAAACGQAARAGAHRLGSAGAGGGGCAPPPPSHSRQCWQRRGSSGSPASSRQHACGEPAPLPYRAAAAAPAALRVRCCEPALRGPGRPASPASDSCAVLSCFFGAGLCHDLGHGPFSHSFQTELVPKLLPPGERWCGQEWAGPSASPGPAAPRTGSLLRQEADGANAVQQASLQRGGGGCCIMRLCPPLTSRAACAARPPQGA